MARPFKSSGVATPSHSFDIEEHFCSQSSGFNEPKKGNRSNNGDSTVGHLLSHFDPSIKEPLYQKITLFKKEVGVGAKVYSGSEIKLEERAKRKNQKSKPPSLLLAGKIVDEFALIRKREVTYKVDQCRDNCEIAHS